MDNLANKIMQYFHDRLVANGIDPAEIKGKETIFTITDSTEDAICVRSVQYSHFNPNSITKRSGESYIKLEVYSIHKTQAKTNGIPDLTTIISEGKVKKYMINIAAQELKSDAFKSGGQVVLNENGMIEKVKDIPKKSDYMDKNIRAIVRKGASYQTAIGAMVDHFSEDCMPAPRHRILWKDGKYK